MSEFVTNEDEYKTSGFHGNRHFCIKCQQRKHSEPNIKRCTGGACECKCNTHYVGKDGKLRPYGIADDSIIEESSSKENNNDLEKIIHSANIMARQRRRELEQRKQFKPEDL